MASDERLCLAYLADDQQLTGILLIYLGAAWSAVVAWRPLFGLPRARPA
jgi:hypothetical protein